MTPFARLVALARNLLCRPSVEQDLDDELRAYVDLLAAEHVKLGMAPASARRAALLEAGGVDQVKESVRDVRVGALVDVLSRDLRFGARSLLRTPVFATVATIALALGIGATTALLSVVNAVLLRPLPYADADRLVVALHDGRNPVAPANFADWQRDTRSFAGMAAAEYWTPDLTGGDDPGAINALRITSGMLPILGVPPVLGRVFTASDEQPGNEHVAIISYGLWQRRFAADPHVLGTSLSLGGNAYQIIGVMPRTFQFAPFWATHAELWAPLVLGPSIAAGDRGGQSLRIFARLAPNVTFEQARADLSRVTSRLEHDFPGTNRNVELVPLKEKVVGPIEAPLIILTVAVVFVLLIACANVAHMLLARAAARSRELAIRAAIGATRSRLVTQMLVESGLLAVVGGIAGLALAVFGIHALVSASPAIIPRVAGVRVDPAVFGVAFAVTTIAAIVFGLVPALRASRLDLAETFRDGDRASTDGRGRARTRSALVASEFALALVLLAGAGLMIRSVVELQHIDPGFDPRNVLTMRVSTAGTPAADSTRHAAFYVDALSKVKALPGVESASYVNHVPLGNETWGTSFRVEGQPAPRPGEGPRAIYRVVFPGYFATMRLPIVRGRDVAESDRATSPGVAVINEFMAKKHWPGVDPVGKRFALGIKDSTWITVAGVAKNDVRGEWSSPPEEEIFLPFLQQSRYVKGLGASRLITLVVRVACARAECDASALAPRVKQAIRSVERAVPIIDVQTMRSLVDAATEEPRLYLVLLGAFATIAVILAAVGIYGVMSYAVSRRAHEIGIRIALGAQPSSILRGVVRDGLSVAVIGAVVGLVAALALTRLMRSILYGIAPTDAVTFASVTMLLVAVAAIASLIPAVRATRVDPLEALRSD
jgi:putative ABC transport system permease protein